MRVRIWTFIGLALLTSVGAVVWVGRPDAEPAAPRLETIRYVDLAEKIRQSQGRVVVVDFWADFCLPCKKEFPKLVALHRKYADAGLTCMSVSLDDFTDEDARERAAKFLARQNAAFPHFLLAERSNVWQDKLKIDGPPCVFVFDRQGRLLRKFHDDVDYVEIEKLVDASLKN